MAIIRLFSNFIWAGVVVCKRGVGWYRLHLALAENSSGLEMFLKYDGAFLVSEVYVNGHFAGEHQGGCEHFSAQRNPGAAAKARVESAP